MTMRHKLSHILLLTGLCALAWSSTARALSLEIVPASHFVAVGTSTSVDLVIAGLGHGATPSLSTFDLNVLFDPTSLSLTTTDANGDGVIDSVVLDPTNQLDVLGLGGNIRAAGLTGPGTLHLFDLSFD